MNSAKVPTAAMIMAAPSDGTDGVVDGQADGDGNHRLAGLVTGPEEGARHHPAALAGEDAGQQPPAGQRAVIDDSHLSVSPAHSPESTAVSSSTIRLLLGAVVSPDRDDGRRLGDRVGDDRRRAARTPRASARGDHLVRRALGADPAVPHGDQVVGVPAGEVEVVHHDHDGRAAPPVEVGEQVEHLELVAQVEVGGRLVEQQQIGLLGERHRDPDPLPLAAAHLLDRPVGQLQRAGGGQRLGHGSVVVGRPLPEPALVRVAASTDQIGDGDALRRDRGLRQQAHHLGDLLARDGGDGACRPAAPRRRSG